MDREKAKNNVRRAAELFRVLKGQRNWFIVETFPEDGTWLSSKEMRVKANLRIAQGYYFVGKSNKYRTLTQEEVSQALTLLYKFKIVDKKRTGIRNEVLWRLNNEVFYSILGIASNIKKRRSTGRTLSKTKPVANEQD